MTKLVSEKLGIKPGSRAILINAPASAVRAIKLPRLKKTSRLSGEFDYIHFFAHTQAQLDKKLPSLRKHLKSSGMLWLSWPKNKQLETDLTLLHVIRLGYDHGLVESKAMSINETWSASKFTHPKTDVVYRNSFGKLKTLQKSNDMKKKSTSEKSNNGWKTCSRGHKYRGAGPCPVCWPGGKKK